MASVASGYYPYAQPVPQRSPKPMKDPNRPKKKKSAFDVFRSEQMQEFKRLNPETKVDLGVFMTNLSATWAALSDDKKIPYVLEAEKDGVRFEEEMSRYVPAPEYANGKKKKRKRVKEPGEPKRATTGFMFFSNLTRHEVTKEHPEYRVGQVAKILGEKWGKMTEADKAPYQKMADDDKVRYTKELEAFRMSKMMMMNGK